MPSESSDSVDSAEITPLARGRVERLEGEHDNYPNRRWVTWPTYLDGELLGNAVDEAEGWRWIADMLKLEARNA